MDEAALLRRLKELSAKAIENCSKRAEEHEHSELDEIGVTSRFKRQRGL
jgi:hypothetical protein